jgi:hypothetical protein
MRIGFFKKAAALLMCVVLVISFTACGKGSGKKAEEKTEAGSKVKQNNPEYAGEDVVLPENFGNMIYPIEAILVEAYSKELPYYTADSSEDEAESFWFTMAVLTSQMNHYVKDVAVETKDGYIYIDEDTMNMYASALYDAFGKGELEFPDVGDDNPYANYDSDKEMYGFREGTIGDLAPYITDCKEDGKEYELTVHLKNKDSAKVLLSSKVTIVPTSYESEENAFDYSVQKFKKTKKGDIADFSDKEADEKSTTEKDEETKESSDDEEEDNISQDDAMDLAKTYYEENYGGDAEFEYKDIETIGEVEYYDIAVNSDTGSSMDILVSLSGEIVMGGTRNSDGSWSLDQ